MWGGGGGGGGTVSEPPPSPKRKEEGVVPVGHITVRWLVSFKIFCYPLRPIKHSTVLLHSI